MIDNIKADHIVDLHEMVVDNTQENKTSEIVQVDEGDVNSFDTRLDEILHINGAKDYGMKFIDVNKAKQSLLDWHNKQVKSEELDILIRHAQMYHWKENGKYDNSYINGKGLNVTKDIIKARKKLIKYIKRGVVNAKECGRADMNLDDLIDKFKAYCQGEGDYDELDFKSDLIDWRKGEK